MISVLVCLDSPSGCLLCITLLPLHLPALTQSRQGISSLEVPEDGNTEQDSILISCFSKVMSVMVSFEITWKLI